MKENDKGFRNPVINSDLCIGCKKCTSVCILNDLKEIKKEYEQKIYAAVNKDEKIRCTSSSGGVFYELGKKMLSIGGVVYAVVYDEVWNVCHKRIIKEEDLKAAIGSKYVQSEVKSIFKDIKNDLDSNQDVLFVATPCQVDGLQSFLGKKYDNLITVDFVCHGVPSSKIWQDYIHLQEKLYNSKVNYVNFRSKEMSGWSNYNIELKFDNGQVYKELHDKDKYFCLFLENYILRESCYECKYRSYDRVSDMTLGDYWGINNIKNNLGGDRGTSMVMVNSKNGECFFTR